jgi:hypothetical protein
MSEEIRSDLDFVRDVLINALDERRDELVGELFELYNKIRESVNTVPDPLTNYSININTTETDDGNIKYDFVAGGDYMIGGIGQDVISFGDYQNKG